MAEQDNIQVARANVDRFSAKDWSGFGALLAPDCVYEEIGTGRRFQGRDQILRVSQEWAQAFPDARGTVHTVVAGGDKVALEITWEGTQSGPLPTPGGVIPPSGRRAAVRAVQVLTIADGKITENRHYIDIMALLAQIGAMGGGPSGMPPGAVPPGAMPPGGPPPLPPR
jgi:steroid delta-isomerase-like uncharacterized protein